MHSTPACAARPFLLVPLLLWSMGSRAQLINPGFENGATGWSTTCGMNFSTDVPWNGGQNSVEIPMRSLSAPPCWINQNIEPLLFQELPIVQNGDMLDLYMWVKGIPDIPANAPFMAMQVYFGWMTSATTFSFDPNNASAHYCCGQVASTWSQMGFQCTMSGLPTGAVAAVMIGGHAVGSANGLLALDNVTLTNGTVGAGVQVSPKVWLDGAFVPGAGLMRDDLRTTGLLPLLEPYTALNYGNAGGGGGETVAPSVLAITGNNAIVDWVHVDLISTANPGWLRASSNGLLQRDGDIVATDGFSPLHFTIGPGNYFVAVRHRNHMGAMPTLPPPITSTTTVVDLRSPATLAYQNPPNFTDDARRSIGSQRVLWSGDIHKDGAPHSVIRYTGTNNDRDRILAAIGGSIPTATLPGYHEEDVNLDGVVKYAGASNDRDLILLSIGGLLPTDMRYEQLPW